MSRIIIFAPHPDDETLGCGGVIAKHVREGHDVFVIYLTDGRYALKEIGEDSLDPILIRRYRKIDALKAAEILGVPKKNLFFLNIEDQNLRKHLNDTQRKVVKILKNISPHIVYIPQKFEYNIDHRLTYLVAKIALNELKLSPIEFQYAIAWKFPFNILANVLGIRLFGIFICKFLKSKLVRIDVSKFLPIKRKAIYAYKSQISFLFPNQKKVALRPSFLSKFLKNEEFFFVTCCKGK